MKPRITQNDIARVAGVHNTTVSLALRNSPSIPCATRERIHGIAAELGYRPDPALQALVSYRTGRQRGVRRETLAYVTNGDTRLGWQACAEDSDNFLGAERKAAQCGYQLEHFWLREPGMSARRLSDVLFHRGIAGVVLAHVGGENALHGMEWSRMAAIHIGPRPDGLRVNHVSNDHSGMMRLALRRAQAAGYERIGAAIPETWDARADQAWSAGFLAEQARAPFALRVPLLRCGGDHRSAARGAGVESVDATWFESWFRRHRPDAIISHLPFVRPGWERLGAAVTRGVAFVELSRQQADRGPGVQQPCQRVGEVAVELLVAQLQRHEYGLPAVPMATLLDGGWADGESLPARTAQREIANEPRARIVTAA